MAPRSFRAVCVYCGSSNEVAPHFKAVAAETGRLLAGRGITVVYGGGSVGLMGTVADAALAAGGRVVGVIPEKLQRLELGHQGLTELHVVPDMHTRKRLMADLSGAFIALPGGWGTMEEIAEATTWTQLNDHLKPVGILNHDGYYDALLAWVGRAADEGFIRPMHRELLRAQSTPAALLADLETCEIPHIEGWIGSP